MSSLMRSKRDDVLFKRVNTNELLPSVVFVVKTDSLVVNNHVFFSGRLMLLLDLLVTQHQIYIQTHIIV